MLLSRTSVGVIVASITAALAAVAVLTMSRVGMTGPIHGGAGAQQVKQEFANLMTDEAAQMYHWLRIATGETVPCGADACVREESFHRVMQGLVGRCEKIDPSAQFDAPAYDSLLSGRTLTALKGACDRMTSAKATLGEPRDSADWRAKAAEAKTALRAVEADLR